MYIFRNRVRNQWVEENTGPDNVSEEEKIGETEQDFFAERRILSLSMEEILIKAKRMN